MFNESGESGHLCLVPDLSGNAFSFSPLSMMFAVGLSYMAFIMLRFLTHQSDDLDFFFLIYLVIYFWVCWVFVSVRGLSPFPESRIHSSLRCAGLSLSWPLPLRSTGSRRAGSVVVAHGPSCSVACGIFPDQGSNPCPLH